MSIARHPSQQKSAYLSPQLNDYLARHTTPPDALLAELTEETATLGAISVMQISPAQGSLMTLLTAAAGVERAIEIGTFTGYSALCIARGLRPGGHLLCLDVSREWTSIAQKYWARAGVADRIELRLGPAADTLAALPEEPAFDLAFIDADKTSYSHYYELLFPRLRPGALILADNVLQGGAVLHPATNSADVAAIKVFNETLVRDPRLQVAMLPVSDGLTLARKIKD
jgi:caffeoyl-CoA O-methyltransferase